MPDDLQATEALQELKHHVKIIKRHIDTVVEVATSLAAIRKKQLYRHAEREDGTLFTSFAQFCQETFDFSPQYAGKLINSQKQLPDKSCSLLETKVSNKRHDLSEDTPQKPSKATPQKDTDDEYDEIFGEPEIQDLAGNVVEGEKLQAVFGDDARVWANVLADVKRARSAVRNLSQSETGGLIEYDGVMIGKFREILADLEFSRPYCILPTGPKYSKEIKARGWLTKREHDQLEDKHQWKAK